MLESFKAGHGAVRTMRYYACSQPALRVSVSPSGGMVEVDPTLRVFAAILTCVPTVSLHSNPDLCPHSDSTGPGHGGPSGGHRRLRRQECATLPIQ